MPVSHKVCNRLLHAVEQTIETCEMFQSGDSVIVGVSGGPDSVALLHVLFALASRLSLRLGVAHLNHSLRQKDSDNDAEFVESLAKKLDLPYYVSKKNVRKYQLENKLSPEEAARCVRYAFYNSVAVKNRFNKIALGHNKNDNAELVLMYLFRGSGLAGISGMPPVRDSQNTCIKIVRPLIRSTRCEIIDFLISKGLKYVLDSSNKDTKYFRNRIRRHLIPSLETSYNPRIIETLDRFASIARCEEEWIENIINPLFEKSVSAIQNDKVILSVPVLDEIHAAAKRRVIRKVLAKVKGNLRRIAFSHIDSVIRLSESRNAYGRLDLPDRIRVKRNDDILIFSKENKALRELDEKFDKTKTLDFEYKILKPGKNIESMFIKEINAHLKFCKIDIKDISDLYRTGNRIAFFDMVDLNFPLILRNFRPGDRFKPLGMSGTQKVKKYFINNKISRSERSGFPVLLSGDKIIWVVGLGIDDFARIKPLTRNVLKAEILN